MENKSTSEPRDPRSPRTDKADKASDVSMDSSNKSSPSATCESIASRASHSPGSPESSTSTGSTGLSGSASHAQNSSEHSGSSKSSPASSTEHSLSSCRYMDCESTFSKEEDHHRYCPAPPAANGSSPPSNSVPAMTSTTSGYATIQNLNGWLNVCNAISNNAQRDGEPKICLLLCVDDNFEDCSEYETLIHEINTSHEAHLRNLAESNSRRTGCAYLVRFSIYDSSNLARQLGITEEDVPLIKVFRLRGGSEPWEVLSKGIQQLPTPILKHELEAVLDENYSIPPPKGREFLEPSCSACSSSHLEDTNTSQAYLVVGQVFTETARQSILSLAVNKRAILVICFSQDYEKVIEFWAEYAKTEKADRLNVLSGSFSSLESSRDLMARAATIIGMEINHLYIHYPYISSSRWRAVQSIIRKPTFEAIFDLNPGGGDYVNFENGETELQARWKTVAKPRMVQDLQNDSEGPDQGLSATALTIAFLEKKLENRPVLEQQIVIKILARPTKLDASSPTGLQKGKGELYRLASIMEILLQSKREMSSESYFSKKKLVSEEC